MISSSATCTGKRPKIDVDGKSGVLNNPPQILLYIIYHDDKSKLKALHFHQEFPNISVPVFIRSTRFFESIAYREILPMEFDVWKNKDYVGILSYKVAAQWQENGQLIKLLNNASIPYDNSVDMNSYQYDVVPFSIFSWGQDLMGQESH